MKKTLLKGLNVLSVSLMISSCQLEPFVIDYDSAELVRKKNGNIERISCYDSKLQDFACFERKDLNTIEKCFRRSGSR